MKYRVLLTPEAGRWNAVVSKVAGCVTWGRSLGETRRNVREAIAALAAADGRDAAAVERDAQLVEELALPVRTRKKVDVARDARSELEAAEKRAALSTAAAVAALVDAGLSTRDIGDLLGLSHQRIQQLKAEPTKGTAKSRKFVVREQPALIVAEPRRRRA